MEEKIAIHYYSLLADKSQIAELRQEIEKNQLPIDLVEREPRPVASLFEAETITTVYVSHELLERAAGAIFDAAIVGIVWKVFTLGKNKVLHILESGKKESFIKKHFIRISIRIDKTYEQYFLISNNIPDEVAKEGLRKLKKASKKFQRKKADARFTMDYIRLKKDGKWRKIKDIGEYRMKMLEKERQKQRNT